ncbi:phosphoribosylaminoimidazole carboxylase [subsurface metagenome]
MDQRVVIMAGSESDRSHIEKIIESLKYFEIPFEVRICSAHKNPDTLLEIIRGYNALSAAIVFVAVAGGSDALSGTLSFHALHPVISCPPDTPNESCLTNPPGSANAYIANTRNVGKFAAQAFAHLNPRYRKLLEQHNREKVMSLEKSDKEFRKRYTGGNSWEV